MTLILARWRDVPSALRPGGRPTAAARARSPSAAGPSGVRLAGAAAATGSPPFRRPRPPYRPAPRTGTRRGGLVVLLLVALAAIAAARTREPGAVRIEAMLPPAGSAAAPPAGTVTGAATFYGAAFQGQPMADGAPFDLADATITAANAWPLGTQLRVRRVPGGPGDANLTPHEGSAYFGRSIVVTVTDRGAFTHLLDLSHAAFAQLGRPAEGVIHVQVEPLPGPPAQPRTGGTGRPRLSDAGGP
jgi:hypothetical protein